MEEIEEYGDEMQMQVKEIITTIIIFKGDSIK